MAPLNPQSLPSQRQVLSASRINSDTLLAGYSRSVATLYGSSGPEQFLRSLWSMPRSKSLSLSAMRPQALCRLRCQFPPAPTQAYDGFVKTFVQIAGTNATVITVTSPSYTVSLALNQTVSFLFQHGEWFRLSAGGAVGGQSKQLLTASQTSSSYRSATDYSPLAGVAQAYSGLGDPTTPAYPSAPTGPSGMTVFPIAGTLSNFQVACGSAPGIGFSFAFAIQINGAPSATVLTVAGAAVSASTTSVTVSIPANAYTAIAVTTDGAVLTEFSFSCVFTPA